MPNQIELLSSIDEKFQIRVFGKKVSDVEVNSKKGSVLAKNGASKLVLVKVYGTKVLGKCIKLQIPFFTLLPDTSQPSDGCGDLGNPDEYLMWILGKDQEFVSVSIESGSVEEILNRDVAVKPLISVNSDFHIHNVQVTATSVSGVLRAYLRVWQPGPFGNLFDVTIVNGDFPFSVNINTCITVATVAVVSAQVCFNTNPNRVCGQVSVGIDLPIIGHWGPSFTIACVNV